MRLSFNSLPIAGKVVIGEGEKDEAPMLYNGEIIGMGNGPSLDIAVDPVEGTNLLAYGRPNAIAVVGAAPGGSMYNPGPSFYMQKLVVGQAAVTSSIWTRRSTSISASSPRRWARIPTTSWSSSSISPAIKSSFRKSGPWARASSCIPTATSPGALMAVDQRSEVDVMMGTGGTPEGVLAACAIKGAGGAMLARLDPQSEAEKAAIQEAGIDLAQILDADTLVQGDDVFFAATGISGGTFLRGVQFSGQGAVTHSMIIRSKTGTMRYIESHHNWNKLMQISSIKYD